MEYATEWWQARKEKILMRKRILFAILLATTSLLVACGSTSTQDNQDVQNTQETTNQAVVSTQEDVVQEDMEGKKILVNDDWEFDFEYITSEERYKDDYKIYFNLLEQVIGSDTTYLEDTTRFQIFEEYRPNERASMLETQYRHILVQLTNPNGTSMMIDIPHNDWDFSTAAISNNTLQYRPQNEEQRYEEIIFKVEEIPNERKLLKDYGNIEDLDDISSLVFLQDDYHKLTSEKPKTFEYEYNEEDNYAKLIYKTDYMIVYEGNAYDCSGYTCLYEDYETMTVISIVYCVEGISSLPIEGDYNWIDDFLDYYIVIVDNEYHFTQPTFLWTFPQGIVGETQKTPMENGMSINVTSYTNSNNQEIKFHWYGPETLGEQAEVGENGLLTLKDKEGNYRLNVQQIPMSECKGETYRDDELNAWVINENHKIFSPLQEYEHYVEGCVVDYSSSEYGLYPITTDDGYKGYAYVMYSSQFKKPNDEVYFITYVEKENVYDDERALEVIKSIDYHLGIE